MGFELQVWKRIGETPRHALERARKDYRIPNHIKGCYTERLDPMAQGLMTMLFGGLIHNTEGYNARDKVYRFQAVLGISTTSYDPLGRITNIRPVSAAEAERFHQEILGIAGEFDQPLPPCSAYRYAGKPLWKHAASGTLPNPLPTKRVKVYNIKSHSPHPVRIDLDKYRNEVLDDINDFRMAVDADMTGFQFDSIINDWNSARQDLCIYRMTLEAAVGSGTFVRSLVYDTGQRLGIPAHAFRITRIRHF